MEWNGVGSRSSLILNWLWLWLWLIFIYVMNSQDMMKDIEYLSCCGWYQVKAIALPGTFVFMVLESLRVGREATGLAFKPQFPKNSKTKRKRQGAKEMMLILPKVGLNVACLCIILYVCVCIYINGILIADFLP